MRAGSVVAIVVALILATGCSNIEPHYFRAQLAWVPGAPDPSLINSAAFAKREPPPGAPGYLDTIRYIDDGVKYIDPFAEFFVSFDGQICFRGLVNRQAAEFEHYQNYWCMPPTAVNNVEGLQNNVSHVNSVRLWCTLDAPQCAERFGIPNFLDETSPIANSITAQTVPFQRQSEALQYLIYLMGGNARQSGRLGR
jgi:hypothetical protein